MSATNLFAKLQRLLPPSPVLVGTVTAINEAEDYSTVELVTNQGTSEYASGVATGSRIRARGTFVPVGEKAFVRDGVIETRAPSDTPLEIEVGIVTVPPAELTFSGPIPDQDATVGSAFSLALADYWTGGTTPLAFSLTAGALPAGLSLAPSTGVVSGTPTTAGTFAGSVFRATDMLALRADSNAFGIEVSAPPPARWVAVASTSRRVWYSDDRGATWVDTGYSFAATTYVEWGGGTFVAADTGVTSDFYTSPDGVTWTLRTAPASTIRYGVAWNGSIFVAASLPLTYAGPHVLTSPDGVTWTARTLAGVRTGVPTTRNICWATDRFVLSQATPGAGGGATNSATSPDGVTWAPCEQPYHPPTFAYASGAIKVGSTYSILPGNSNNKIYTTTDFATFTQVTLSSGTAAIATSTGSPAARNGSTWVIASPTGLRSTTDGLTFVVRRSGAHTSVRWDGAVFVADGGGVIATSPDGVAWTVVTPPFTVSRLAVAYSQA